MSGGATDFGLFREKVPKTRCFYTKMFVIIISAIVLFLLIIYTILYLTKNSKINEKPLENNIERPLAAEKLILADSSKRPEEIPEPFGIVFNGPNPKEFSVSTNKIKTLLFPQLNAYQHNKYPKNIQDIIGYVTKGTSTNSKLGRNYKDYTNESNLTKNRTFTTSSDPFYLYKPQDPGDINLLATASFRFAPPIWKNFKNYHQEETTNKKEILKIPPPLVISLNIYPNHGDYENLQKFMKTSKNDKMIITFNIHSKSSSEKDTQETKRGVGKIKKCF